MTKTTVAIAYDFDGTLARGNIQENSFIPELVGYAEPKEFWTQVDTYAQDNNMDKILAYMHLLIKKAQEKQIRFDKESLKQHGATVDYFEGVETYFDRIKEYAKKHHIAVKHYIISSGTKEMIEGTSIAKHFEYIYASSFKLDQHDVPEWPAVAINYTTKTQYLFRINKQILDVWDEKINEYTPEEERPIPFSNIIYVGDGLTDVPAMKMVNYKGGTSIGVYPPYSKNKQKVKDLVQQGRVSYAVPADYSEGQPLDKVIKAILLQIATQSAIAKYK